LIEWQPALRGNTRLAIAAGQIDRDGLVNVIRLKAQRRSKIAATRQERRSVRNFSRNRPDATNLNHQ
jgi:hypothetical protein